MDGILLTRAAFVAIAKSRCLPKGEDVGCRLRNKVDANAIGERGGGCERLQEEERQEAEKGDTRRVAAPKGHPAQ